MGSNVYWADTTNNAIVSVPTTGGTPTTIVSQPSAGAIDGTLATDGTHLYFGADSGGTATMLSTDGTGGNQQTVATGLTVSAPMLYLGGKLYAEGIVNQGSPSILQIPTSGGSPVPIVAPTTSSFLLLYVDTSGVYFDGDASPTFSTDYVSFANAGTTSTLFTTMTNGTSSAAGLLTVGGTAYFVNSVEGSNDFTANLYKSTGGAMGTMVAMYPGVDPIAFIGDANGAFLFGSSSGTKPGVYKVDLGSGTATMWGTGQPKQGAALDAKNVYFIDSASDLVALTR